MAIGDNVKKFLWVLTILVFASPVWATNYYVTQSGAGTHSGTSIGNAWSVADFNSSSTPTGGDTVYFSGTFSSVITSNKSGSSSSSKLVLDGAPPALTAATIQNSLTFSGKNYITAKNFTGATSVGAAEIINCTYITIENFHNTLVTDYWVYLGGPAQYITFKNNSLTSLTSYGFNSMIGINTDGGAISDILIEGNYMVNQAGSEDGHPDLIQSWGSNSQSRYTVRYNWMEINAPIEGNVHWFMLEYPAGPAYCYGNVFVSKTGSQQPFQFKFSSGNVYLYNNTFVSKVGSGGTMYVYSNGTYSIKNNITYTASGQAYISDGATPTFSNNLFYGGDGAPSISENPGGLYVNPQFSNYSGNNFALSSSSPAITKGTNLGAGPTGQWFGDHTLNLGIASGATWPNPTLALRSTWDMGAYVYGDSGDVTPPVIDNLSPNGVQACTSLPNINATLSFTTDDYSTSKYSLTDVTYANMAGTFGTYGYSHSQSVSVACGSSVTYYIATSSAGGISYDTITFSVASPQIAGPGGLRITGGRLTN